MREYARLDELIARFELPIASDLPRGEFFAGLFILGCVNGLTSTYRQLVRKADGADALFNTSGISVIIWISCAAGVYLIARDRTVGVRSSELLLGVGVVVLTVLPIGSLWAGSQ